MVPLMRGNVTIIHTYTVCKDLKREQSVWGDNERTSALDVVSASIRASISASRTAACAAALWKDGGKYVRSWRTSSAGSDPLSSAAARTAQPASVIWVSPRSSSLSFVIQLARCVGQTDRQTEKRTAKAADEP